jgi:uroporphyrinogen decarboxylase
MTLIPGSSRKKNFAEFREVLKGNKQPDRVHLIELWIDEEMIKAVYRLLGNTQWRTDRESMALQRLTVMGHLGYDLCNAGSAYLNLPVFTEGTAKNTAILSEADSLRHWAEEGHGIIRSWADFHAVDWESIIPDPDFLTPYKKHLPEGMKLAVGATMFEFVLERWMGYEGLFTSIYENPELVDAVFRRVGDIVFDFYKYYVSDEDVGVVFHADDLGFKTSLMISPKLIRKYVISWTERLAEMVHRAGKLLIFHSCGRVEQILPDLIAVGIDGFHSFQDLIMPIAEFRRRYPGIAALGGVDVDALARMNEKVLREYVRKILDEVASEGKFALGAGNTVTNYMPVENYLAMVDEAQRFNLAGADR